MPLEEIIIDKDSIDVLSSDTRVAILKSLDSSRRMTITGLTDALNLSKSTVHEHLTRLVEAGFVKKMTAANGFIGNLPTKAEVFCIHTSRPEFSFCWYPGR